MADHHHHHHPFSIGEKVEVSTDEEGFQGSLYVANITSFPTSRKCEIEYETLMETEDSDIHLTETVDIAHIRPLPPLTTEEDPGSLKVNDVVDAFHRDGWWIGVVACYYEGGASFWVSFDEPPDELCFNWWELRHHLDLVDGKWQKPQPRKTVMGMTFYEGAEIEVSLHKKDVHNVWYCGTILSVTDNNSFLVEFECSGGSSEPEKRLIHIDSFHIRPSPPRLEGRKFVLHDEVDVYDDFCWLRGMISAVRQGEKYLVLVRNTKKKKEFDQSGLRFHMLWNDGKWTKPLKATRIVEQVAVQHYATINCNRQKKRAIKSGKRNHSAESNKDTVIKHNAEEIVEKECIAEEHKLCIKAVNSAPAEFPCETPDKEFTKDHKQRMVGPDINITEEIHVSSSAETQRNQKKKRGRPTKSLSETHIAGASINAQCVSKESVEKDSATNEAEANAGMDRLKQMTNDDNPNEDQSQVFSKDCESVIKGDKKLMSCVLLKEIPLKDTPLAASDNVKKQVARKRVKQLEKTPSNGQGKRSTGMESECSIQDCQDLWGGITSESNEVFSEIIDEMSIDEGFAGDQPLLMWIKENQPQTVADIPGVSQVGNLDQTVKPIIGKDEDDTPSSAIAVNDSVEEGNLDQTAKKFDRKDENDEPSSAIATNDVIESSKPQKIVANGSDLGAISASNLIQCSQASDRECETGTPSATIVISDSMDSNQTLPFLKNSSIWKTIESMEIFQKTPQKPHFSPLVNCNEDIREGLAIAHMVNFSNIMERTSKLRVSDPRSCIERSLATLVDLKSHGFDVEVAQVHLIQLLSKKDKLHELQLEHKKAEDEIMKNNLEKAESEKGIDEIQLKMKELGGKLTALTALKEMKQREISTLGLQLDTIREKINGIQLEY